MGRLPTHAAIVWTDVGRNDGGEPFPSDLVDNVEFEVFDANGNSVAVFGPFSLGDQSISRTTEEDRFLGYVNRHGISAISIRMPGKNNWEVDHLQYGFVNELIFPIVLSQNKADRVTFGFGKSVDGVWDQHQYRDHTFLRLGHKWCQAFHFDPAVGSHDAAGLAYAAN